MPSHHMQQSSPYSQEQLFNLVIDVEQYPDFIPWCRAARILSKDNDSFLAELVIAFKHIRESYVSRVKGDSETFEISVIMERGPFHHLTNHWKFLEDGDGCIIDFHIEFAFKSKLLETVIGALFSRATKKMVHAFSKRAEELYG